MLNVMVSLITQPCHFKARLLYIRKLIAIMEVDQVDNLQYTSPLLTLMSHTHLNAIQQISLTSPEDKVLTDS